MSKVILKTEMLSKSFSNRGVQQHVLKNMNLDIYSGDFTVIMGNSGAGKSTLLYALSGLEKPTLGNIKHNDEEITKYSNDKLAIFRRKNCGFVFQQIHLNDTMSVLDNVLISGYLVNKNRKEVAEKSKGLLLKVGLSEIIFNKFPSQLSGGEAQRVGIVRALINNPKILFADEPTGALNSSNSMYVLDVMTERNKEGQSIVMVTHDIKSASRGNRILYLKDGVIINEINLGKYSKEDEKARLKKLQSFLDEMGW